MAEVPVPGRRRATRCRSACLPVLDKDQKANKMWGQMQGGSEYVVKPYTSDDIVKLVNTL